MKTVIAPGTRIAGALSGKDDLEIYGTVDGPVHGEALVTIAAGAKIGGEVRGRDVIVAGELQHSVIASAVVRLTATARVTGDIEAPRIAIDEGAVFEGSIRMMRTPSKAATPPPTVTAAPASAVAPVAVAPVAVAPAAVAPQAKAAAPVAAKAAVEAAKPATPQQPVASAPKAMPNAPTEYSRSARGGEPPRSAPSQKPAPTPQKPAPTPHIHPHTAAPASVATREIPSLASPGRKALIRKSS